MKTRLAAIAAAAVLVVGGGTAYALTTAAQEPTVTEASPTSTPTPTETPTTEPSPTSEPLVAEDPDAISDADAEAAFLEEVRDRLRKIRSQIPNATDEQLLTAAREACERIEGGESSEGMSLIEGEELSPHGYYMDSGTIITSARLTLCPPVKE